MLVSDLLEKFQGVRGSGRGWAALCPAHPDKRPSLSICEAEDGRLLLYCHAGCQTEAILESLRLDWKDLYPDGAYHNKENKKLGAEGFHPPPPIAETVVENLVERMTQEAYAWLASQRGIFEEVARRYQIGLWEKRGQKRFSIPIRDDAGHVVNIRLWLPAVGEYTDPEKRKAAGKIISWPDGVEGRGKARLWPLDQLKFDSLILCEGEMDALALLSQGIPAMTGTGGAGVWREEWSARFKGKVVTVVYDADQAGRRGAEIVADSLWHSEALAKILSWPEDRKEGHDVTDELLEEKDDCRVVR